jgi:hypothetical protein
MDQTNENEIPLQQLINKKKKISLIFVFKFLKVLKKVKSKIFNPKK